MLYVWLRDGEREGSFGLPRLVAESNRELVSVLFSALRSLCFSCFVVLLASACHASPRTRGCFRGICLC